MSDETKKSATVDKAEVEEKPETVKKSVTASKKVKAKNTSDSGNDGTKKNIVEKLRAMGVMPGKKTDKAGNNNSETGGYSRVAFAAVLAATVAGSFVWALNKEAANEQVTAKEYKDVVPSAYPQNRNTRYPAYNYAEQQKRIQQQREQQNQWMQQQRQAQEAQRVQQQKWAEQYKQAQEQQRIQQQKWAQQQQQAQAQQRAKQQKWAQQQPTPDQYRAQQQQWAGQQRQAREQQRLQQQYTQSQPMYTYPPNAGYQGQPAPGYYNVPAYQQPAPYYGRQY